jgi:ribonuclease T2
MPGLRRVWQALPVLALLLGPAFSRAADPNQPGIFDYYVLVLSWMPAHCRGERRSKQGEECAVDKRHGFLLHGLWPQYEKGWPENCSTAKRPWVPERVIEEMRDIMPSRGLVIHEYRTHGTCSGLEPAQYYGVARELYERVRVPAELLDASTAKVASLQEIERAFLDANPWLKSEMIAVTCRRANLFDIRVCFGRDLFPQPCGVNEDQKRLCPLPKITVPPVTP